MLKLSFQCYDLNSLLDHCYFTHLAICWKKSQQALIINLYHYLLHTLMSPIKIATSPPYIFVSVSWLSTIIYFELNCHQQNVFSEMCIVVWCQTASLQVTWVWYTGLDTSRLMNWKTGGWNSHSLQILILALPITVTVTLHSDHPYQSLFLAYWI